VTLTQALHFCVGIHKPSGSLDDAPVMVLRPAAALELATDLSEASMGGIKEREASIGDVMGEIINGTVVICGCRFTVAA
jgi:hypothetical protein